MLAQGIGYRSDIVIVVITEVADIAVLVADRHHVVVAVVGIGDLGVVGIEDGLQAMVFIIDIFGDVAPAV